MFFASGFDRVTDGNTVEIHYKAAPDLTMGTDVAKLPQDL